MSEAVEFGTNMLNELLLPPWTLSDEEKKFESVQEALAFVQVSEMIAGKILSILPPGQKATLSIDKVSTILLQTIPESHKTRYNILRDVQSSFIDLKVVEFAYSLSLVLGVLTAVHPSKD